MTLSNHAHSHDDQHPPPSGGECIDDHSSALVVELREHVPFSVSAVAIGLIAAGTICVMGFAGEAETGGAHTAGDGHDHGANPAQLFFHLFHPAHMLFSAVATTAMFSRYDRNVPKAVAIGLLGAIGVCGVSDIVIPHLSLWILQTPTEWHICAAEHPGLSIPFAVIGVAVGLAASAGVMRSTIISHSLHVFASTMASIFYMVGPLGIVAWIDDLGKVFLFVVLAVVVPCCLSDIVFPLLMTRSARERYNREPHSH